MEEEKKDFVIRDRRSFGQEQPAEKEEKQAETEAVKPDSPAVEEKETAAPESSGEEEQTTETQLPEINFQTFIFSLNASALVQLGAIEDPASGKTEKNLPVAKQTIDMLTMLQEKTAGNLTKEEEEMLKYILYDLRIRYVKEKE